MFLVVDTFLFLCNVNCDYSYLPYISTRRLALSGVRILLYIIWIMPSHRWIHYCTTQLLTDFSYSNRIIYLVIQLQIIEMIFNEAIRIRNVSVKCVFYTFNKNIKLLNYYLLLQRFSPKLKPYRVKLDFLYYSMNEW